MKIKEYISKVHKFPREFTQDEFDKFIEIQAPIIEQPRVSFLGKPIVEKGQMDGEKFDSKWEALVWIYYKKIKCVPIERNKTEYLMYYDNENKQKKFYPDFIIAGRYVEVKGFYRESDMCKRNQHPEVEFIDSSTIGKIQMEVEKMFPNWKQDYIKRFN